MSFININIKNRLQFLKCKKSNKSDSNKKSLELKNNILSIPFYKYMTPLINKLAKELNFIPVNRINDKFNNMIRLGKDKVSYKERKDVF